MERRVTPLELFFDLVFVFAFTQVTGLLADDATWEGLAHALMILALLWWSWECYAWLTNTVDPEEEDGPVRTAIFGAMGAMLIVALTVPGAFDGDAVTFGVAYFLVRALHPVLYLLVSREDPELRGAVMRFAPPMLVAPALIVVAGFFSGTTQAALWVLALLVDYVGLLVGGVSGWRVDAAHFAERHALIIIIALGESIVAIGVGAADLDIDGDVILAAVFALVVAAGLWWSYFDVAALVAARRLAEAAPRERALMARDSFTYLHLPMVAGIILFALGVKKTLEHGGDALEIVPAVSLCGGVALYLVAHVLFRLRNVHTLNRRRLATGLLCAALVPVALELPALATLGVLAALVGGSIVYEAIHFAQARARIRHAA
jgi:low temperature requirement protein LtrA